MSSPYRTRYGAPLGELNPAPRVRSAPRDEIDLTWQDDGACRELDPAMFYPERGVTVAALNKVRRVCAACPVVDQCREHGLHHEKLGMWGGLSERQRRVIRKERGISLETPGTFGLSADLNRRDVA